MKKLNNKGFILVETLIVTVFVVSLFIVIYQATVPVLGEYEQQNKYDDIDSVYYSNLYKQMVTRYADMSIIDTYLQNASNNYYIEISDCDGKIGEDYIYHNRDYCKLIQENIGIGPNDKVFITDYNISNFKAKAKELDYFDSDSLSNFRNYLNTVSDVENFYSKKKEDSLLIGKYRLFLVREIDESDKSVTRRYANIGIYTGKLEKYNQGELVYFNPGDGEKAFYVLKNSPSTDTTVTLILASNLEDSTNTYFNCTGKFVVPDSSTSYLVPAYRTNIQIDNRCSSVEVPKIITEVNSASPQREYASTVDNTNTLLVKLKSLTSSWTNANSMSSLKYEASAGYTIDYNGYNARLVDQEDILEVLGCRTYYNSVYGEQYEFLRDSGYYSNYFEDLECFNKDKAFAVDILNDNKDWFTGLEGFWTAIAIKDTNIYAWAVKDGRIEPTLISSLNVGIRPVIVVDKDSEFLRRG